MNFFGLHFGTVLSYVGRICISFLSFQSGYGLCKILYREMQHGGNVLLKGYRLALKQMIKLYTNIWWIGGVFITIGYLLHVYKPDKALLLRTLLGISYVYNEEWWYISYYIRLLILFPLFFFLLNILLVLFGKAKCRQFLVILLIAALSIIRHWHISGFFNTFMCFLAGMAFVVLEIYEVVYDIAQQYIYRYRYMDIIGSILLIACCLFIRVRSGANCDFDYIFTPVILYCICVLTHKISSDHLFVKILEQVGRYSTCIWLSHTFFAYYCFQHFIYMPRYSGLIFILCIGLCMGLGKIIEPFRKKSFDFISVIVGFDNK